MSYRVLVLPDHGVLSIKALRKVAELARAGATVIGYRTQETASLVEYPESEEEVTRLAQELWGNAPVRHDAGEAGRGSRQVGRGIRSEEHTSELQSLMRISYAVFSLK